MARIATGDCVATAKAWESSAEVNMWPSFVAVMRMVSRVSGSVTFLVSDTRFRFEDCVDIANDVWVSLFALGQNAT